MQRKDYNKNETSSLSMCTVHTRMFLPETWDFTVAFLAHTKGYKGATIPNHGLINVYLHVKYDIHCVKALTIPLPQRIWWCCVI